MLDRRHVVTHAFDAPARRSACARPCGATGATWRPWRIGVLFNNWYFDAIQGRLEKTLSRAGFDERLAQINRFERMLANEGTLLVKLWFHLSKPAQKARFEHLESDPDTAWRVTRVDWKQHKRYDRLCDLAEHALRHTSKAHAPWTVVEGVDARYRAVTTGRVLLAALRERLDGRRPRWNPSLRRVPWSPATAATCWGAHPAQEPVGGGLRRTAGTLAQASWRGSRATSASLNVRWWRVRRHGRGRQGGRHPARHRAWMRAATAWCPSPPHRRDAPIPTCGASGITCRGAASSPCSTAPGTERVLVERVEGYCSEAD